MASWKHAWREGLVSGTLASLLSTAALVAAGRRHGRPMAPVNAVSHWVWGDRALRQDAPSRAFTGTGFLIHHGASLWWALLHAKTWGCRPHAKQVVPAAVGAAAAASVACFVDFQCTPRRLTPGFEHRLTRREMAVVYGLFAVGLAIGSLLVEPEE